jgi:hypothetical protein
VCCSRMLCKCRNGFVARGRAPGHYVGTIFCSFITWVTLQRLLAILLGWLLLGQVGGVLIPESVG